MSHPHTTTPRTAAAAKTPQKVTAAMALTAVLAGCATTPQPITAPSNNATALPQAVQATTEHVIAQLSQQRRLPEFLARWSPEAVFVAPVADPQSRQQTQATAQARQLLLQQVQPEHYPGYRLANLGVPGTPSATQSVYRIDSQLTPVLQEGQPVKGRYVLDLQAIRLRDGAKVASSRAQVEDAGLDATPTAFYQEAPVTMLKQDPSVPAQLSELDRTRAMALMDEAQTAFDARQYDAALSLYQKAVATPGVDMMPALVGVYLSELRLGHEAEAKAAFAKIVSLGLQAKALGVKLLFAPGKTEFWSDPAISKPYPEWLAEIARQAQGHTDCMQVVGHSSRTGGEQFNVNLSEKRAQAIRDQLVGFENTLGSRLSTAGMGWRENLVGAGTDDLRDAVDRRVEFKVVSCG